MNVNTKNAAALQRKYKLSYSEIDGYVSDILSMYGSEATVEQLENYIIKQEKSKYIEYDDTEVIDITDIYITSNIDENNSMDLSAKEIEFSDKVKLPSLKYCKEFWGTGQNKVVIPSRHINSIKKIPVSTLIAVSLMSAKEGVDTTDETGKGARIMNVKRVNKMYENIINTRKIKPSTINSHIRKLLKLKNKEFEFVTLENINGKENQYYRLDYSDGFVNVDIRIIHFMYTCYSDAMIQAYIIFLWNCRNGWSQITQEQMAVHLGLTEHSYRQAKMLIDKLVMDGFIEQKCSYQTIQEVDKETGIPKSINRKYFEYNVVSLDEIIEKMQ